MIPAAALDHHLAFLGKTGSGKSNAAKVVVEADLDAGNRVCILDPTGAWYGLRLNAKGKPSKYPVVIFGGLHADVAIGRDHGAAVAEVVATSATPAVIDTRLMTVGERTAFFTAFAQTLLRSNRGPLRLVIDEAHLFAPQGRVADPRSGEMLHAANNLVSLGRSIGLRVVLISQRPAKLHKDSLTQVETLVAMRLIAPQDRRAIEDWIGEWAEKDQGKEIISSLPSLPTGDAWIWSPEIGFLERKHFPLASTYDSGKAPTGKDGAPELQPLELAEVSALLQKAAADLKANDPRHLKAEVARLQRELAAAQKHAAPAWPDQRAEVAQLRAVGDTLYRRGIAIGISRALDAVRKLEVGEAEVPPVDAETVQAIQQSQAKAGAAPSPAIGVTAGGSKSVSRPAGGRTPAAPAERMAGDAAAASNEAPLTGPQRHLLEALLWWKSLGHDAPTRTQLAAKAGWTPKGSNLRNRLSELHQAGLVEYPRTGTVRLTPAGAAVAPIPDVSETLIDSIRAVLTGPQRGIFDVLLAHPGRSLSRPAIAGLVGWEASGSNLRNRLSELSQLELVEYPARGEVALQEWVQ
ncbi:MAG TPA: DUF87 domain-containing protein [Sphingomicrobium sp.]|nr:DUF87 domain-containing protein [Sphingomicrobium sp.]